MISLTTEERHKFATWLEQQASASAELLERMENLSLPEMILSLLKLEVHSLKFIAKQLREVEE